MDDHDWLAERFEAHRTHLRAVAYRILGSPTDAEDAVQEAWLRLSRSESSQVENLGGWLTTAERLAFVLHDMFAMPFEEIAPIVERTPAATRQLASRARRRVQGADTTPDTDLTRRREVVRAFLAASRNGDLGALVAMLDPDVVVRADPAAVRTGAEAETRGAQAVAATFSGRARAAKLALIDGVAGLVWASGGRPRVVFSFTLADGKITAIDLLGDPAVLEQLDVVTLPAVRRG